MSPTNAANAQAARRPAAPTRPAGTTATRAAMQSAPVAAAVGGFDDHSDEFRLNLSDIPRMQESLDVEGLKPTLLSRLLDLVAPIKP
jgi:hypothetical protein